MGIAIKRNTSAIELSFAIGETLLENGAEISRVQETMQRVANAYHTDEFNVFVVTNAIFANGIEHGVQYTTKIRSVPDSTIHIGRISALNQLSREIEHNGIAVDVAFARLVEIRKIPFVRPPFSLICCGVGSACCALLFGGKLSDAGVAFCCGFLLETFLFFMTNPKPKTSKFMVQISASALVATVASLVYLLGIGHHFSAIVGGAIIRLVPGVALTTSIRDFFNGDYLSGTIRMIDAILIGVCLGVGVGVVIRLISLATGGTLL